MNELKWRQQCMSLFSKNFHVQWRTKEYMEGLADLDFFNMRNKLSSKEEVKQIGKR